MTKVKTGIYLLIITFLFLCIAAPLSWSHSGPIDSSSGHYNGQTGVYHYHVGKSIESPNRSRPRKKPSSSYHSVKKKEGNVYVTRTGERYHVHGCRYLGKDPIRLDIKDAQKLGYTACSTCDGWPIK